MVHKKVGKKWHLYSRDGSKLLGKFDTLEALKKREKQIQFFKWAKKHPEKVKWRKKEYA